jgi:hypothetical protein
MRNISSESSRGMILGTCIDSWERWRGAGFFCRTRPIFAASMGVLRGNLTPDGEEIAADTPFPAGNTGS